MKRLLSILCVVLILSLTMTAFPFAATADIVNTSIEGTAIVDGVKDDAYAGATALEFVQKGVNYGANVVLDEPIGYAYIINDSEWVYVYIDVIDDSIDKSNVNTYEQDSTEVFWMDDNVKYQLRCNFDSETSVSGSGTDWAEKGAEVVGVTTDTGYAVEYKFPITDVLNNQIEMCIQINACTNGTRNYTCYILGNQDGDNAVRRLSRDVTDWDVWWTLTLAGEFEDTREETVEPAMEITVDNYQEIRSVPFSVQGYMQDHINWTWNSAGSYTTGKLGDTLSISWNYDQFSFDGYLTADNTTDWIVNPTFAISVGDAQYLQLPDDAVAGTTGESARYSFTYSDVTITATGYDDVVISGDVVDAIRFTVKQENGYTSGVSKDIDLLSGILEQTGLTLEQFASDYLPNLTNISFDITFDAYELVTLADIDAFLVELDAEDEEVLASLQEYIDRVDAAEEIINDETTTLEEKEEALDDAKKAANRATKGAEGYTKSTAAADELQDRVATLTATVEALQTEAEPAEEVAEEEVTADEETSSSDSSSSGSAGLIVGIVILVVVIVVVVVVAVVTGKKKKA
ncbi:MAG: hypothetical protein LUG49_00760 [Oscillospiraceae bacterium]|nr:hypothetical protein [Oscillospiraceae bacterium]